MMLTKSVENKLNTLKLNAIASQCEHLLSLSSLEQSEFEHVFEALLDIQIEQNQTACQNRMRKAANLRWPQATLADINFTQISASTRRNIEKLSTCDWLNEQQNVVFIGATGTGKTTFACALANHVILQGYKVKFVKYHDLLVELEIAESADKLKNYIRKLLRVPLIIIDDWALTPITSIQRRLLFDLIERLELQGSLIITSQFDFDMWHEAIGEETIADALLDRIAKRANKINLEGGSYRQVSGLIGSDNNA